MISKEDIDRLDTEAEQGYKDSDVLPALTVFLWLAASIAIAAAAYIIATLERTP